MRTNPIPEFKSPLQQRLQSRYAQWLWRLHTRKFPVLKRAIDLLAVIPALLVLSPLFALVALAIWLQDRGPVLFWQKRVGRFGQEFDFPKFRSMRTDAEAVRAALLAANQHGSQGVTFKMKRDPRITAVGRWIRRTSIDELPQLWCVLKGQMSLVGPRPPLPAEVARYTMAERERLSVTPGLTCIWQVSGRSEIPFPQQVQMDIAYIQRQTVGNDIKLIAKTLPAVVRGRGAY
ncbi:MAG: sugar transferase [Rhodoferax sp.]|nr:sugar transferase [Rhodoferax sp.]